MVKNCDRGLENNARGRTAYGLGQYFQDRGHSFSPYGPTLSRVIAIFIVFKLDEILSEGNPNDLWP